ncbi:ABC transporter substrate-binding protein [Marinomonas mediterranea]|uniref:ABC transporter substrate-binding protein n=1 Tax=Marinomonas mediterranea TaxID=119864 RepID=UPI0023490FEB|nr:ABC transporter substrate-binding protein [Marinomonas mediterranea]WCN12360.1 ABC transporter substrate-binding protein [Marinomonas mediterranea]
MFFKRILWVSVSLVCCLVSGVQAAEMRMFENQFGKVEVPVKPKCVVSLHDFSLTVQLYELGIRPCGSVARKRFWSEPYFRGVEHRFDTEGLVYVGSHKSPDEEAIAMLEPDLIIGLPYQEKLKDKLSNIAPVVILPTKEKTIEEWAAQLADLVGETARYKDQKKEYQWVVSEFKRLIPNPEKVTVTTLEIYEDNFQLIGRGGLDEVIADMGLGRTQGYKNAKKGVNYSLERISDLDADVIIDTYEPLLDSREETEEFRASPQWKSLFAVKNNQFLYFNRSRYGDSMGGLIGSSYLLLSHLAERDLKTQQK